ncbi:MAG TPA: putative glycolipid-binding domain-containing protein [Longimicrobiales bacterium]|nr:putative glycolipid-binding domain-containing protein [Longimicrobiales bacterium]
MASSALWRRLDTTSLDHFRLLEFAGGYILDGRVLMVLEDEPAEIHYAVMCDAAWVTQHAHVMLVRGTAVQQLQLRRDDDGRWWCDDVALPELDGIIDVDISITPATNTLPIRRLSLGQGESGATDAAWVRLPGLSVERLPQRYTRVSERSYRYESRGGAFTAELEVDAAGVVVRYGDLWERATP